MMAAATAFTIIGKMGATASFSMSFVMTPEIYPTNLRYVIHSSPAYDIWVLIVFLRNRIPTSNKIENMHHT